MTPKRKARRMTAKEMVLKRWPSAKVIPVGAFDNAPSDPFVYISTRHHPLGGQLIGKGDNARQAWADAAKRLRCTNGGCDERYAENGCRYCRWNKCGALDGR